MQRVDTSRRRRPAGHGPVRGDRQRAARRSIGTSSAPGITILAPAFGQALPTLATVPTEYNHEVNAELFYDLCAALVKAGLGSPETWERVRRKRSRLRTTEHHETRLAHSAATCSSATSNITSR